MYLLSGKVPILGVTHDSLISMLSLGRFSELCMDPKFNEFVRLLAQCISPDANDKPRSMSEEQAEKWWQENEQDLIASARAKDASAT